MDPCFETISFAPIDIDLIELSLLNNSELEWINNYHKKVREKINREKVFMGAHL